MVWPKWRMCTCVSLRTFFSWVSPGKRTGHETKRKSPPKGFHTTGLPVRPRPGQPTSEGGSPFPSR